MIPPQREIFFSYFPYYFFLIKGKSMPLFLPFAMLHSPSVKIGIMTGRATRWLTGWSTGWPTEIDEVAGWLTRWLRGLIGGRPGGQNGQLSITLTSFYNLHLERNNQMALVSCFLMKSPYYAEKDFSCKNEKIGMSIIAEDIHIAEVKVKPRY